LVEAAVLEVTQAAALGVFMVAVAMAKVTALAEPFA
jgi:hypothetical protein